MKIALFSDVHANLPALQALFNDFDERKPDAVYCLGDLVGYNVWPNEVVQAIRKRGIPTIAGNYDFGVGRNSDDCGCAYKSEAEKTMGAQSIAFTNALIGNDERNYLRTLPAHLQLEFQLNNDQLFLLMVHGSPRKINEYLFEDRDPKSMLRLLEQSHADVLFFGHTHKPYHRIFEYEHNGKMAYRHAVNIGSVGKPKDGDARACYAMITIHEDSSKYSKESIEVEFIRVMYDVEKAAKAVEQSVLPNAYADMLREAR
ncbi:MAG: metallophosphoesterase family protein [Bacteroidota bacterium]|jgi:predicted phosphodiesterase